jgi:hypothetical protein
MWRNINVRVAARAIKHEFVQRYHGQRKAATRYDRPKSTQMGMQACTTVSAGEYMPGLKARKFLGNTTGLGSFLLA